MERGAFIVIDGTDGSGKGTQTKLLVERLKTEGYRVETISFPQYGTKSAGPVEEYLSGKYGSASEVGAKAASILYAVDRFDAAPKIRAWLSEGAVVVADRYVGSNMGHQGSKITNPEERHAFFQWEAELEHGLFGIPAPDVNIVLHVPADISMKLMAERDAAQQGLKSGLKKDVHESDPNHLRAAEQAYIDLTKQFDAFKLIECIENGTLRSPNDIHQSIWTLITPILSNYAKAH